MQLLAAYGVHLARAPTWKDRAEVYRCPPGTRRARRLNYVLQLLVVVVQQPGLAVARIATPWQQGTQFDPLPGVQVVLRAGLVVFGTQHPGPLPTKPVPVPGAPVGLHMHPQLVTPATPQQPLAGGGLLPVFSDWQAARPVGPAKSETVQFPVVGHWPCGVQTWHCPGWFKNPQQQQQSRKLPHWPGLFPQLLAVNFAHS